MKTKAWSGAIRLTAITAVFAVLLVTAACGMTVSQDTTKKEKRALVLMYHHVVKDEETALLNDATITVGQLRDHLIALRHAGYNVIPMSDFVEMMEGGRGVPEKSVVLTFDDGYESFYTLVYPLLKEMGMTASNFVVGYSSDMYNPEAYPHLSWEQMKEMKKDGMSFYSHTYNLHHKHNTSKEGDPKPALTIAKYMPNKQRSEDANEYIRRVKTDLSFMEKRLKEELGEQISLLALPYGYINEQVLTVGQELGIKLFFLTEEGINHADQKEIYRINAGNPHITSGQLIERMAQFEKMKHEI
ncbi:polysaccharide deacetylase family protein [Paenibacillus larvae]|nr:polysaccharide deacetylase family protein [Paenibacillus larvae]MDT2242011.1 polysaccharide deacetylase family protein [Paenibacillus larvae]MDT2264146.1 polysaccharide deacetylase family protein [Paenibacillus larvae]MDT2276667.1 polysaccharide deacetylase family protein [Paenibacillus larvae]